MMYRGYTSHELCCQFEYYRTVSIGLCKCRVAVRYTAPELKHRTLRDVQTKALCFSLNLILLLRFPQYKDSIFPSQQLSLENYNPLSSVFDQTLIPLAFSSGSFFPISWSLFLCSSKTRNTHQFAQTQD